MTDIKLRPYKDAPIRIPGKLILEIDGKEDTINYPIYGTIAEKTEYINLLTSLSMISQSDDMI